MIKFLKEYKAENLRIVTRVVLVFSIVDDESKDVILTSPFEEAVQETFKEITGHHFRGDYAMVRDHSQN